MHIPTTNLLTLFLSLTPILAVPAPGPIPNSAISARDLIPDKVRRVVARAVVEHQDSKRQPVLDKHQLMFDDEHDPPEPSSDIDPPRADGLVPFAGGGPVLGKFVKPTFTPTPEDNVLPFPNSVELKKRRAAGPKHKNTASNAFCPYPGTAYCCSRNFGTGGTLCRWNGDGHLSGCELINGGESVCCTTLGCKGMEGLKEPVTTV